MADSVTKKLSRIKDKFFSGIIYLVGILLVLTSLAVISYQIFLYLYKGGWTPFQFRIFLEYTPYQFYSWVIDPDSWLGLHRVVRWFLAVPLSFGCFVIGYLLMKLSDFIALFSD